MAAFCHFWGWAPATFWNLEVEEYFACIRFMRKHEQKQANAASGRNRLRR